MQNGALVVRGGFTHYPQSQEAWRFFRGDPNLPSRIVVLDGSGSLSFDVLDWLAGQGVPLIRIDWKGEVQAVLGGSGYGVNLDRVTEQLAAKRNGGALRIATDLIRAKIDNSIETLRYAVPRSSARDHTLAKITVDAAGLRTKPPSSIDELLGIEGASPVRISELGTDCQFGGRERAESQFPQHGVTSSGEAPWPSKRSPTAMPRIRSTRC